MTTKCKWNDVEYASITAAAIACGITKSGMLLRVNRGHTCDADVASKHSKSHSIPTTWEGVQYPSIRAAANANNASFVAMKRWIKDGFTRFSEVETRKRYRRNQD